MCQTTVWLENSRLCPAGREVKKTPHPNPSPSGEGLNREDLRIAGRALPCGQGVPPMNW